MSLQNIFCLDKSSKKFHCPKCTKKSFVLFIDKNTGEYLPDKFGRCDRESKCSYFKSPYSKIKFNDYRIEKLNFNESTISKTPIVFFDSKTYLKFIDSERYSRNKFLNNLLSNIKFPFVKEDVFKVAELYQLGTILKGYRAEATLFPFIDIQNKIRAVQVKQFNEQNHTTGTDFLHSILEKHYIKNNLLIPKWLSMYIGQEKRVSCLFGEHLLTKYPNNPVALVEAPKTAIYGTLYFGLPKSNKELIWLAVFNSSSFSFEKLKVLEKRTILVFPDLSENGKTFKEWENKAKIYESRLPKTRFVFSDLLEHSATEQEKSNGLDLADYLIKLDWRNFREQDKKQQSIKQTNPTELRQVFNVDFPKTEQNGHVKLKNWDKEINEIENFLLNHDFTNKEFTLNQCTKIYDSELFIKSHLTMIKHNNGNVRFYPYLKRLLDFKSLVNEIEKHTHYKDLKVQV